MSNLTRIQPQVSLIIHYTGVQQTIKGCYLKKTPSHFMLSAMAPHGREMSQDLRKKIISLHKKCSCGSVVEHCVSSAKVVGSIPREHMY